jgi:hypothetical protein
MTIHIKMPASIIIIFIFIALSPGVFSQQNCSYDRQSGKLEITKQEAAKTTTYKTDSCTMVLSAKNFVGFLVDKEQEAIKLYQQQESLLSALFTNGLLTPDLIIQACNAEVAEMERTGDTSIFTTRITERKLKILNIERQELPSDYKDKKGTLLLEVWATFIMEDDSNTGFITFELKLHGDIEPTKASLNKYLQRATIKCLAYTSTQFNKTK